MQYLTNTNRDAFIKYRLPIILIVLILIGFNILLYARLTSDNPRPDLADQTTTSNNTQAVVNTQELNLEGGVALIPSDGTFGDSGWHPLSGNWIIEGGVLRQTGLDGFDQAIVYEPSQFEAVAFDVTLRHFQNVGGGVLFNMQNTESFAGSQLVRFEADGSALFWGAFDENSVFAGQGFAPVNVDLSQPQRLIILNRATTYDILLNDLVIAQDIPLVWQSGHIGLAVSQADVAYQDILVWPLDGVGTVAPEPEGLLSQTETISGEWIMEGNVIRQLQSEATDYVTSLNVLGTTYTLEAMVNMTLDGTPEDSGAGFMFHMPDRANRAGATMVRFLDQGDRIVWGQFDNDGVFQGAGNLEVGANLIEQPLKLAVRVTPTTYDILINDEVVISDLPLRATEGWVGLVAFRGEIEFSDVRLNIGE